MDHPVGKIIKGIRRPKAAFNHIFSPYDNYRNAAVAITSRFSIGTHVLSEDWDVLVLLDTCRVDALEEVADEYAYLSNIDKLWSVGGNSPEWIAKTFDKKWKNELSNTAYISSNAWAEWVLEDQLHPRNEHRDLPGLVRLRRFGKWDILPRDSLGKFEKVWEYVHPEDRIKNKHGDSAELIAGGTPPRYVTDRGIAVARNFEFDRLILHYTQPHHPYLANAIAENRDPHVYEVHPFRHLNNGGKHSVVWESYLDELRWVLDDISILLLNIDAETVVLSADHGEAFGEYGVYKHNSGSLHPYIKSVPWAVTSARNNNSYTPQINQTSYHESSVADRLEALGYKE